MFLNDGRKYKIKDYVVEINVVRLYLNIVLTPHCTKLHHPNFQRTKDQFLRHLKPKQIFKQRDKQTLNRRMATKLTRVHI